MGETIHQNAFLYAFLTVLVTNSMVIDARYSLSTEQNEYAIRWQYANDGTDHEAIMFKLKLLRTNKTKFRKV